MKEPVAEDENIKKIEEMFETRSIWSRLHSLMTGLAKPRGSREYKEAIIELQRLMAPIAAILIPTLAIAVLIVCATPNSGKNELLNVQIAEAEEEPDQEDTPEEIPQEVDVNTTDVEVSMDSVDVAVNVSNPADMATPTTQTTPITTVDAVMDIRAPVMMKTVFSSGRSAAGRKASLAKYGGDAFTEACVMRALRWLVTQQREDGSWPGYSPADGLESTGFVVLTFLSHGEKPGSQSEFGKTVQRGLEYLMKKARAGKLDAAGVHALAEAYGMTRNPNVRSDVEHALNLMADRLAERVWGPGREGTKEVRPRLLPMTFETMALRSAKLSHFKLKNMDRALMKLKEGFLIQGNAKLGGFSNDNYGPPNVNYRRTGIWHSMVGVVAMQYLGAINHPIIEKTLRILDDDWEPPTLGCTDIACCPVRGNYWATMVFFNNGGKRWLVWNAQMKRVYVGGQQIIKNSGYVDQKGKECDIGYWVCEDMHMSPRSYIDKNTHKRVYGSCEPDGLKVFSTCYITQQLMVYYRYLPTSSKEAWNAQVEEEGPKAAADDVKITIDDL